MSVDLTAEEIKEIRSKYQMSRKTFAQLLGIGEASLARYESGAKPTKANANLIRAAKNPRFMAECLDREADALPEKLRDKTQSIVCGMVYFNGEGEVMDMTDLYMLTLEQEILNEYAASVMADIWRLQLEAEEEGDEVRALILDDMGTYLAQIKPEITGPDSSDKEFLAELRGRFDSIRDLAFRMKVKAA